MRPRASKAMAFVAVVELSMLAGFGVMGFLMFGIALDTRAEDFRRLLRMPVAFAVGIVAQFLLLPAITFGLTLIVQPAPSIALGMILVACCPPGNVSNILTHRANGNVALSVSMTAVSNAISIVAMPLNLAFWGSLHPSASGLLRSIALDPMQMLLHILMIIGVPFVLGWALRTAAIAVRGADWFETRLVPVISPVTLVALLFTIVVMFSLKGEAVLAMPLDVLRLRDSDLAALSSGDEFKAAVLLWCVAWHQVPAASLPNDDRLLARYSGTGALWRKVKAEALRGFVECDDGRLYHATIAEKASKKMLTAKMSCTV